MFPVLLDTCSLYSATLRDTLLRIAEEDAFRPLWSAEIIAELTAALVRNAHLGPSRADRVVVQMQHAFPDAEITDYSALVDSMTCHPKDRHVLAAAVAGGAQVLVTFNVRDFPVQDVGAFSPSTMAAIDDGLRAALSL